MQLGPQLLWHRLVRGVSDQEVTEAKGVVADECRLVGPEELLSDERLEVAPHVVADLGWGELGYRATVEDLALDGGAFDVPSTK